MSSTEILLIDDHLLLCDALGGLIEARFPGWTVRQAGSLQQGLAQLGDTTRLVLVDLGLPDASGLEAVEAVRRKAPEVRLVVLSADDRAEIVQAALELGASGFVSKRSEGRQLLDALAATLEGAISLPTPVLANVTGREPLALTPRQLDVLRLVVAGNSNKHICRQLQLSESSVKTHLEAIYRRLGVGNRTQAVVAAARLGLRL